MKKMILMGFVALLSCKAAKPIAKTSPKKDFKVSYQLSMPEPQTHYFEVELTINSTGMDSVLVKMPVWAPGSYLIREFARNVDSFGAVNLQNETIETYKKNKNTWVVKNNKQNAVKVRYSVYANEISVRTSFIDADHGYLNGTSVFMYVPEFKNEPSSLKIIPFEKWKTISTGLEKTGQNEYQATNYDILADSPIEIGNQKILTFDLNGINHNVAMVGNYKMTDETQFLNDLKKVCENSTKIFNENPCKEYTFIVQHYPSSPLVSGGGLEHLNSTTLITRPEAYTTEKGYRGFMSLAAHEYFHLWNVKRIRPVALGPFDYENENYTTMLWVAEGFTSFYQDMILRKGNQISENDYVELMNSEINLIENQPGSKIQSVSESSKDAWIKYYRPNENSRNSTISYYDKGGVIGMMMNLLVIGKSNGQKNLDNVYQLLWKKYNTDGKGYTETEFKNAIEAVSGENLNPFFKDNINGTKTIDYNYFLNFVGLKLTSKPSESISLGVNLNGNKITSVVRNSAAYQYGLNVNDEIQDVDGMSIDKMADYLKTKKIGDEVMVNVKRFGLPKTINLQLSANKSIEYKIEKVENPTNQQTENYKKWLFLQ
jgi:predicted metalloprotease with PDZ domain